MLLKVIQPPRKTKLRGRADNKRKSNIFERSGYMI